MNSFVSADPHSLNRQGMAALQRRDFATAARYFEAAAGADPQALALWTNLATAYRHLGHAAGERSALDRVLALDQLDFMANLRLAQWHERHGNLADATLRWQGVLVIAPPVEARTPELAALLDHGTAIVARAHADLAAAIDGGLGAAMAQASPIARRRFGAAVDFSFGRRRVYANECSGFFYPFLPADEYFDEGHFPWFAELEAQTEAITAELRALLARQDAGFRPYVSQAPGTPVNHWTPLDGSTDWSSLYLYKYGQRDERVCALCPQTAAAIEAVPSLHLPGRSPNAFFSVLAPGSHIPPHTGVTNTRTIVHLGLVVPPECGFRVGDTVREWQVGKAFAFDDTIEHEAWNRSDEPRAVLIMDVWNPHLSIEERALIERFYALADASGHRPAIHDVAS